MSLNSILNNASSGLATAQAQLRIVSDNVANVNTKGYVRKIGDQQSLTSQGVGSGVEIARVRLATDRFLQAASLNAGAEAGRYEARSELYDRIQGLFGDPGSASGFFSSIDGVFAAFGALGEDAPSSPRRQEALSKADALFSDASRIASDIQSTREDADGRIATSVDRVNGLLQEINALNVEISRTTARDGDASGAQGAQAMLIAELGNFLDVRSTTMGNGGISLRTGGGALLVGPGAATLEYQRAGSVTADTVFNDVLITEPGGQSRSLSALITTGEIKGLLELRDIDAPETAERLTELLTRTADELNRAHNAHSAVPAPQTLTGRDIGQSLDAALAGFTGSTTIAVTDPTGSVRAKAVIVFSPTEITINGTSVLPPATFLTQLNAQLNPPPPPAPEPQAPPTTATFVDGALSIATSPGFGVSVGEPSNGSISGPARNTDRGFSQFFGLNDLVQSIRSDSFTIRPDIRQNSANLALARLDTEAGLYSKGLLAGDGRGATALADAGKQLVDFAAAGDSSARKQTVSRYAAELSGSIGAKAAASQSRAKSAVAVQTEATARQSAYEGVNLDEELVLLTTYQQAFNASARLIQASREMYDTLLGMI